MSLPINQHPLFDTADCSEGQPFDDVWFLGGTLTSTELAPGVVIGEVTRNCTVPAGTALFFPIVNTECSTLEGNGTTEEEMRGCANFAADHITVAECTIDDVPVDGSLTERFRTESPLFTFGPLPANNELKFLGVKNANKGATSQAVADGVYLLLAPLPAGPHTLHFSGEAVFTQEPDGFDFTFILDITYNLTVAP
jgi:hypothetical protein